MSADRATIVVVGDTSMTAVLPELERAFGRMPRAPLQTRAPRPPRAVGGKVYFVDRPGAGQAQIMLAAPGIAMASPEADVAELANAAFGASAFTSRLNLNLREKHGYTYWASSQLQAHRGVGPFVVESAVAADHVADALREMRRELTAMCDAPLDDAELARAVAQRRGALADAFQTIDGTAEALDDLAAYELPQDRYAARLRALDGLRAADVQRWACDALAPTRMETIVVGDRAKTVPQLESLGAPIEERDALGQPLEKRSP